MNKVTIAISTRHLHEAKPVAVRIKPHRFAINRDNRSKIKPVRQIVLIQMVRHAAP